MIHKILTLFVNIFTVDEKLYLLTEDNLTETIQMQLSKKQKTFCEFFFAFLKSIINLNIFQKKMKLIADVFVEILAPKNMVK